MSPDEENAVLSQADIDGLMSSTSEIGGETAKSSESPPPAAAPAPASEVAPAAAANGDGLAEVTARLAKLEAAVARLSKGGGGDPALAKQVKELSKQMNEVRQNLPNTLGYGVHQTFQCPACSAQGTVAAHVMCTTCGGETAIGWWPPQT